MIVYNSTYGIVEIGARQWKAIQEIKSIYEKNKSALKGAFGMVMKYVSETKFVCDSIDELTIENAMSSIYGGKQPKYLVYKVGKRKRGNHVEDTHISLFRTSHREFAILQKYLKAVFEATKKGDYVVGFSFADDSGEEEMKAFSFDFVISGEGWRRELLIIENGNWVVPKATLVKRDAIRIINDYLNETKTTEFVHPASKNEFDELVIRLEKRKANAEQHEFITLLKADSLVKQAIDSENTENEQYARQKAMYEILENVFHEHDEAKTYIATKK